MRTFIKKRISIMSIGIIAALLFIGAGVGFYMYAPSNMIALDINPSIEIHTNRLNRVISINPVNEDAIRLMAGYHLDDRDLDTVIEDIVDRMIFNDYLIEGQENKILITSDDTNTSDELLSRVNSVIASYLKEKQMKVQLLQQNLVVTEDEEEVAHANNVSAGKMAIIEKLLENSNGLTAEELASTSIKELIQFSIDQNISLEDLIESNQIDALSSATIKTDAEVSGKDEYADSKAEDQEDNDNEDNDNEDNEDNDNEDNDNEDNDNEDYDIEDKEDQDDSDEQDREDIIGYRDESDSDDSEEGEYSYSREEDNDVEDNDDEDYDDEDNDDEDYDDEDYDEEDNDDEDNDDEDNDGGDED